MKSKKLGKKLALNKETIINLNNKAIGKVRGGNKTGVTCVFCPTIEWTCVETNCDTCYHTCPPTWCDTECGC